MSSTRVGSTLSAATVLAVAVSAATAWATHDEPGRGKSFKSPLVTAYKPCTAPDTVTDGLTPYPACSTLLRQDTICGFGAFTGASGTGNAKGVARNGDIEITFNVAGLGLGCEGYRLCGVTSVRITTDQCAAGPCTVMDLPDLSSTSPTACCTVQNGNCRVKTTVNTEVFGTVRPGQRAGIEILGCGMKRVDGPSLPTGPTFSCGTLAQ